MTIAKLGGKGLNACVSVLCAATMVAACQMGPTPTGPNTERRVSGNAFGNVTISVDGRTFTLKAADDKPLGKLAVQTGGQTYETENGQLALSAGLLNQAKTLGKGFFVVYAQGYSPKQVWIGQRDTTILLSPVVPALIMPAVSSLGGKLSTPNGALNVEIGAGVLSKNQTNVALSGYTPTISEKDKEDALAARNAFLAELDKRKAAKGGVIATGGGNVIATGGGNVIATGGGNFSVMQTAECLHPEILPCTLRPGLGLLLTVDGPINPGQLKIAFDLNSMLRDWDGRTVPPPWAPAYGARYSVKQLSPDLINPVEPVLAGAGDIVGGVGQAAQLAVDIVPFVPYTLQVPPPAAWPRLAQEQALGAADIYTAFNNLDAVYGADARQLLIDQYQLSLDGSVLNFPINISSDQIVDGVVVTKVAGTDVLGVNIEVMIVSSTSPFLPPVASVPDLIALSPANVLSAGGNLISNNAGSLISNNSSSLISNNGSGVIANNGSGLISNNSAGLYGSIRTPFTTEHAKYNLLGFQEFNFPEAARVRAVDELGNPLSGWVNTTANGNYRIDNVPAVAGLVFLEAEAKDYRLRTLAREPDKNGRSQADITTVTTAVTSYVRDRLSVGGFGVEDVSPRVGFAADTALLQERFDQDQALKSVTSTIPVVAAMAKAVIGEPASLNPPVLQKITMKVEKMPDHEKSARGLAIVTGLPESVFKEGETVEIKDGYSFQAGLMRIDAKGFGNALDEPRRNKNAWQILAQAENNDTPAPDTGNDPTNGGTEDPTSTTTNNTDPEPTPEPTPTPEPPPSFPEGEVLLRYTVEVKRGSGETAKYVFGLYVTNYMLLNMGGAPLPMNANLLDPRRVPGALLGNFWTYLGQE